MKIIFFGDSVSEAGRNLSDPYDLGEGYVKIAAGKLRPLYPDREFEILNCGVGGDKTQQLLDRIQTDVIEQKPDVVILEVGVNDVWHRFLGGVVVSAEEFRANYAELLKRLKGTGAHLIAVQPFVLNVPDKQRLRPILNEFNGIISELTKKEKVPVVAMDEIFRGVTQDISPSQFAVDGVHPTHRGCRYIADGVIKELRKIL